MLGAVTEIAERQPRPVPPTPRVGDVIRQLRHQHGISLRELAEQSILSRSFLGAVERGRSDIAVGRLAHPVRAGECAVWPSSHAHTVRNDANEAARAIGFTTGTVY